MASKGIVIKYRDSQYKKKIRLIADYKVVLNSSEIDSDKFIRKLDKRIGEYFDHKYQLEDFAVARMVLTTDIDVREQKNVSAYLKVLQRIGRVKGFSPASYDCFDTGDSFCLEGNSNGIQFLIYDLENLLESQLGRVDISRKKMKLIAAETQGILRAEVRLTKPKGIRNYTDVADISGQIVELSKNCKDIFMDTFTHIVPFGDHYKKGKAVEIIHRNIKDNIMRRKMLQLLALIPEKKSLYLAQKSMNCRNIEKVMEAFAKIKLSPVTISKRQDTRHLKNIYSFVLSKQ